MAQPSIPGTAVGIPRMAYGNDGTDWIAVLVDALGHIQADILSIVLPADAATETKQDTMITALQLIDDLRNALGSVNTDDLQVDVKTSALPSDAATETTLLLIKGYVDALETLLAGGLPAALDSGALKTKEQSPLTGFATSANQATMVTALQLIDDLRAALGSVNTDDLQVDVKTTVPPVPASPIRAWTEDINVATGSLVTVLTYTVTTGKTFYLTDFVVEDFSTAAGIEFSGQITIAGVRLWACRFQAGDNKNVHFLTPLKATSAQAVAMLVYQWSGATKKFAAGLSGFEV